MVMHKKTFSVDVDDELSERFSAQVEERGQIKYRALEGAIRAWLVLPKAVQADLMSNGVNAEKLLTDTFQNIALTEYLEKLSPAQKSHALALAKEGAKKISQKR